MAELRRRRQDKTLARATRAVLGESAQSILKECAEPTGILFRQIATPTHEVLRFLDMTERLSLRPIILEYTQDKFVNAGNAYKKALGKLPIYQSRGSDGRDIVRNMTVIDFNASAGKRLADIKVKWGTTLQDFHHEMLKCATGLEPSEVCVDASLWFKKEGSAANKYYDAFMTLFIRDAVMFENYEPLPHLAGFMRETVIPAFERTTTKFGYRPLIVRVNPKQEELHAFWDTYPKMITRCLP